jgi:outer membrane protein assembly factor BamC
MRLLPLFLMIALAASGCGMVESKKIDYKSAQTQPTLEVPPDLVAPASDNRYAVPDTQSKGTATLSTYNQERKTAPTSSTTLLPEPDKVRIERAGTQRWLVVQATPQQVWPVLKDFWQENGFIINIDSPETGVMETDWAENRAKIPQDGIRNLLGKVIDGIYSTAERDKFRTRVETGKDGTTEIYISQRGMEEVYATEGKDQTKWQPRPPDPELEAEMLRRLMLRFGVEENRAESLLANQNTPDQARVVKEAGMPVLEMDESFERAWRRVGLALDRVGFAVEDRDRSKGVYFVRYIDPGIDNNSKSDEGFFAKFAFWRSKEDQVSPSTQTRIINLLYSELK